MKEDIKRLAGSLLDASAALQDLHHDVLIGDTDLDSPYVRGEIKVVQTALENMLVSLNAHEDKKDEEFPKIPNIDHLFEGHPVNAYIKAKLGFLPSQDFKGIDLGVLLSKLSKAAAELAKFQQEKEEPKKETLEDFVSRVVDSLDLAREELKYWHKESLLAMIGDLESGKHGGYAHFYAPLKTGNVLSKVLVKTDSVKVKVGSLEFTFDKTEEEQVQHESCVCTEGCTEYCVKNISLLDYLKESDKSHDVDSNKNLMLIEKELKGKQSFDEDDYEVICYFLKHAEGASDEDLAELSNRALELAWKRHMYFKNE